MSEHFSEFAGFFVSELSLHIVQDLIFGSSSSPLWTSESRCNAFCDIKAISLAVCFTICCTKSWTREMRNTVK